MQVFSRTAAFLDRLIHWCLGLTVFLVPLVFFLPSFDILEFIKQSVLGLFVTVAVAAWLGKALVQKQFVLSHHWLHGAVLLFGIAYFFIALFSQDRYLSFVGMFGQVSWSFASIAAVILFYVVSVHHVCTTTRVYHAIMVFLGSSLLVAVFGILQVFSVYLFPQSLTHVSSFNSIGSVFSLALFLVVPLVMSSALAFHGCRDRVCLLGWQSWHGQWARFGVWVVMASSLLYLILVDFWAAWVALLFGTALMMGLGFLRERAIGHPARLLAPAVLVVAALLFLMLRSPFSLKIPGEVAPSMRASWNVARQTLQAHPLVGSGPGTWIYDYAKYRAQDINLSPFWTTRFDRGASAFFTLLATIGMVGIGLWIVFIASAVVKSCSHLVREKKDEVWYAYLIVFAGWATMGFVAFLYNYNFSHQFVFWMLLAWLGGLVAKEVFVWDHRWASSTAFGVIAVVFVVFSVGGVSLIWLAGQRMAADRHFAKGVRAFQAGQPLDQVIEEIAEAHRLNPLYDLYTRNLSQARFIRVMNRIQNRPSTDQSAELQSEIVTTVNLAREATERAPHNVDNWSNLGQIYQSIAGSVREADEFAIQSYQKAHELEPQNPVFLMEIGKRYLARAEMVRPLLDAKDEKTRSEARKNFQEHLKLADQYLRRSIEVKPDYLPAHYFLGAVHERQGRLKEAISELEQILANNPRDVSVAFELSILYYRNNEKDRAIGLLERIVMVAPGNANARWYLGLIYEERGLFSQALEVIQPLTQQFPDHPAVQQRYANLKRTVEARSTPLVQPLPEPLKEEIYGPRERNPVRRR